MLVCDDSRDGYRVPACRSSQMNPATASFLPLTDPERPPEPSGTREAALAPSGRRDALGRGRIQPASLGNRTRGTRGSPSPACTAPPAALPSFSSGSGACPAQPAGAQRHGFSPQSHGCCPRCPAGQGWDRASPSWHPHWQQAAPGAVPAGPHPSGGSTGRGGQQRGAGAGRGLAHPCPPRLWSLQRQ